MNGQRQGTQADSTILQVREYRVTALRDLVEKSVYDVPSEDVAASIMRAVIVVAPRTSKRH
jgi:hypothetical protein